jgi:hypothetical protein
MKIGWLLLLLNQTLRWKRILFVCWHNWMETDYTLSLLILNLIQLNCSVLSSLFCVVIFVQLLFDFSRQLTLWECRKLWTSWFELTQKRTCWFYSRSSKTMHWRFDFQMRQQQYHLFVFAKHKSFKILGHSLLPTQSSLYKMKCSSSEL